MQSGRSIEGSVVGLIKDVESLKKQVERLDSVEQQNHNLNSTIVKMELIDKQIFEKIEIMTRAIEAHSENFKNHDEKEMEKYGGIDKRLQKIEGLIYAAGIIVVVVETLYRFDLLKV